MWTLLKAGRAPSPPSMGQCETRGGKEWELNWLADWFDKKKKALQATATVVVRPRLINEKRAFPVDRVDLGRGLLEECVRFGFVVGWAEKFDPVLAESTGGGLCRTHSLRTRHWTIYASSQKHTNLFLVGRSCARPREINEWVFCLTSRLVH